MTKAVIGIDTASNRFHWFASESIDGSDYGWVSCTNDSPDSRRQALVDYAHGLGNAIDLADMHVSVFCEEPLSLQNGKTTRLLGMAAGAIWAAFALSQVRMTWFWVDQSSWKKQVLGRGRRPNDFGLDLPKAKREKAWIASALIENTDFTRCLDPVSTRDFDDQPDLLDAWALMEYGKWALAT